MVITLTSNTSVHCNFAKNVNQGVETSELQTPSQMLLMAPPISQMTQLTHDSPHADQTCINPHQSLTGGKKQL